MVFQAQAIVDKMEKNGGLKKGDDLAQKFSQRSLKEWDILTKNDKLRVRLFGAIQQLTAKYVIGN